MNKQGIRRPGALQIVSAAILALLFGLGPFFMALNSPTHAWAYVATGPQALLLSSVGLIVLLLYAIGCIRYSRSKGYSGWIGFWLCLGHIPGFIAMLVLPDILSLGNRSEQAPRQQATAKAA